MAEKEEEIAALVAKCALLMNEKGKNKADKEGPSSSKSNDDEHNTMSSQDIKTLIAEGIREFQMSLAPPVLGYRKPYPDHYDAIPFPKGYQRPTFDKFDGIGSPQEHLAHFYSACGETSQMDAFLVRQFV